MRSLVRRLRNRLARRDPDSRLRQMGWGEFAEKLCADILLPGRDLGEDRTRELFKRFVRLVEVEPHAYCNRTCSFCPNSFLDRRTPKTRFPPELFEMILTDLASIDYDKGLRFARYSEPMADDHIFELVTKAREALPAAEIDIITNGDYLRPDSVCRLEQAGLSHLRVSVYLKDGVAWSADAAIAETEKLLSRMGISVKVTHVDEATVIGRAQFGNLPVSSSCHDFSLRGNDRGQSLPHLTAEGFVRKSPCRMVFENVTIDYDGTVMPCCNLRGDDPDHERFKIGTLSQDKSIFDLWACNGMVSFRSALVAVGPKAGVCSTCSQKEMAEELLSPLQQLLDPHLRKLGFGLDPTET